MNYQNTFTQFTPKLIQLQQLHCAGFCEDLIASKLLICGEVHGVRQNCDVLYSLCKHYEIRTLAIEASSAEVASFLDSATSLHPDFSLINRGLFAGGMLSVEMAKTIALMIKQGDIDRVDYLTDSSSDQQDREQMLADRILALPRDSLTVCVMGNWHTEPCQVQDDDSVHTSALIRVRQAVPVVYVEYKYQSGTLYNFGTGLATFDQAPTVQHEYNLVRSKPVNYQIIIPRAHAIYFEA